MNLETNKNIIKSISDIFKNNEEEVILGLKDLIRDRESFITEDNKNDPDNFFIRDKQVLEEALYIIENNVSKDKIVDKIKEIKHFIESKNVGKRKEYSEYECMHYMIKLLLCILY